MQYSIKHLSEIEIENFLSCVKVIVFYYYSFYFLPQLCKIFYLLDNMCLMSHIEDISNVKTWLKLVRRN